MEDGNKLDFIHLEKIEKRLGFFFIYSGISQIRRSGFVTFGSRNGDSNNNKY